MIIKPLRCNICVKINRMYVGGNVLLLWCYFKRKKRKKWINTFCVFSFISYLHLRQDFFHVLLIILNLNVNCCELL